MEYIYTISSFDHAQVSDTLAGIKGKAVEERESEHHTTSRKIGENGSPLQLSLITVEVVLVSGEATGFGVLPESIGTPSTRQRAEATGVVGDP